MTEPTKCPTEPMATDVLGWLADEALGAGLRDVNYVLMRVISHIHVGILTPESAAKHLRNCAATIGAHPPDVVSIYRRASVALETL